MAEEQVTPQRLVLDGVSEKLQKIRLNNLTERQQEELRQNRKKFSHCFVKLSYDFFGLSPHQLASNFSASELVELDKLISRKAWPWAIFQTLFVLGVPVVGWAWGIAACFCDDVETLYSWRYLHYRKCFLRAYRDEGFLSVMSELMNIYQWR